MTRYLFLLALFLATACSPPSTQACTEDDSPALAVFVLTCIDAGAEVEACERTAVNLICKPEPVEAVPCIEQPPTRGAPRTSQPQHRVSEGHDIGAVASCAASRGRRHLICAGRHSPFYRRPSSNRGFH